MLAKKNILTCINTLKFILIFGIITLTSCEEIIFVNDISKQKVVLLYPKTNDTLITGDIEFSWLKLEDSINYHFQIAKPSFDDITKLVVDTLITKTNITKNLTTGNYQWRVKGSNFGHSTAYTTYNLAIKNEKQN